MGGQTHNLLYMSKVPESDGFSDPVSSSIAHVLLPLNTTSLLVRFTVEVVSGVPP